MNELIKVNYDNPECPVVSGHELHNALGITTRYNDWFTRMCEYGFTENKDFYSFLSKSSGGRPGTDHMLTIPAFVNKKLSHLANKKVSQL